MGSSRATTQFHFLFHTATQRDPDVFITSACKAPEEKGSVNLACLVIGNSANLQVSWHSGAQTKTQWTFPATQHAGNYVVSSRLSFPVSEWRPGPHKCRGSLDKQSSEKTFQWPDSWIARKSLGPTTPPGAKSRSTEAKVDTTIARETECPSHTPPPTIYLLHPRLEGLWFQKEANFTCLVVGSDLQGAQLSWKVDEETINHSMKREQFLNGSQTLSSHLRLSRDQWDNRTTVTCSLSHPDLKPKELMVQWEKAAKAPSNLSVSLLATPSSPKAARWLLCEVSGFSPPDILLMWLEGQQEVDPSRFATARPTLKPGDATFETWSVLHIPATSRPLTAAYTCVVGHEASRTVLSANRSLDTGGLVATTSPVPQSVDENSDDYTEMEEDSSLWSTLCTFVALFLLTLLYSGFVTFIKVK